MTLEVSDIVIVQSLEPEEIQTGVELFKYLSAVKSEGGAAVRLCKVANAREFLALIAQLTAFSLKTGARPWLHIECHASTESGLEFSNSSELNWLEFAASLRPLNEATHFNLLIGASACYGSHLAHAMLVTDAAPCYAVVGPTDVADPSELLGSFRSFYREILSTKNLDRALAAMRGHSISKGMMGMVTAEDWWEALCTEFVHDHYAPASFEASVRQLFKRLKDDGYSPRLGKLKRMHMQEVPRTMNKYFDNFFMVDGIAGSGDRFMSRRKTLNESLKLAIQKVKAA